MTQEEKIKAYDELLVKAKQIYDKENDVLIMHVIEELFPELVESDDEKIKKELITLIKDCNEGCYVTISPSKIEEYTNWLEKQGEQEKPQVYETEDGEIITYYEKEGYKVIDPKFKINDIL